MIHCGYSIVGEVIVTVTNEDGTVASKRVYNKVTNYMTQSLTKWLSGVSTTTVAPPTQISAGNGSGTPAATDAALWSQLVAPRACDSIQVAQGYYAQYNLQYMTTDPAGYYNELGLFDASGNMWSHVAINTYKASNQTLTAQWMIYMVADASNQYATVTNFMRQSFTKWMTGTSSTTLPAPNTILLGTGTGTVQVSDTALWTPVGATSKACDTISIIQTTNVLFAKTYQASDIAANTFNEGGWVDAAGNLWLHASFNGGATKTTTNILSVYGQVGIVGN